MSEKWTCAPGLNNCDCIPATEPDCLAGNQTALNLMALDAYIYGYPLVLTAATKKTMLASGACINQFLHARAFPDPHYTTIIRPNVDTLYSMAWLDISREPVVLCVPDTHNRYYLMELLDPWTNVFASIGARTTGTREGAFAITGPQWNGRLPEGVIRVDAPANSVWIIGRTQTNGPQDYPPVHDIQDGYTLIPLSCWGKPTPGDLGCYAKSKIELTPVDQVAAMNAAAFFQTMTRTMSQNPPWIQDPALNEKLAALGLVPNRYFDYSSLSPSVKAALGFSADFGQKLIKAEAVKKYFTMNNNGWAVLRKNTGFYGADLPSAGDCRPGRNRGQPAPGFSLRSRIYRYRLYTLSRTQRLPHSF